MGARARGGFGGAEQSKNHVQKSALKDGAHIEGHEQPPGMHGQSAQAPWGDISSKGGVDALAARTQAEMPNQAAIDTNRGRGNVG